MLLGDVEATGRLLDAWSSGTFVYASSQTVYGVPESPRSEESALRPDTWYDLAKIANEHQLAFTPGLIGTSARLVEGFSSHACRLGRGSRRHRMVGASRA